MVRAKKPAKTSVPEAPGLPKAPAANNIDVSADGRITGLF